MKCEIIVGGAALMAFAAGAGTFPYDAAMTVRHRADAAAVASYETPTAIPQVSAMPDTDAVATLVATNVDFAAADDEHWQTGIAVVGTAQASLAIRRTEDVNCWMGYAGGSWVELSGLAATEGEHGVKIDIDYSAGAGNRKVRYAVDDQVLTNANGVAWLDIGTEADKISKVDLYGYGTTEGVVAQSGQRPLEGAVAKVENVSMDYSKLLVDVAVSDSWGVTGAKVVLHDGAKTVERAGTLEGGRITADFSDVTQAGKAYTYDIVLTGGYNGGTQVKTCESEQSVAMYQEINWFGFSDGQFVKAAKSDNVTVADGAFGTDGGEGTVTPKVASSEGAEVVMEATLNCSGAYAWDALPQTTSQFAITLARKAEGDRTWVVKTGSGAWEAASASGVSTANGTYDVKVTADYRAGQKTLKYYVNEVLLATGTLTADKLDAAAVMGGTVSALNVGYRTTAAAPAALDETKGEIELAGNTVLDLKTATQEKAYAVSAPAGKAYHLAWKDGGGRYAVVTDDGKLSVKTGSPANGLESYESHVLGLDAEDAQSVPVIKPVQTADASHITLTIPNVRPLDEKDTGVRVKYNLVTADNASYNGSSTTEVAGPTFQADLPENGVKYYKVKIELK